MIERRKEILPRIRNYLDSRCRFGGKSFNTALIDYFNERITKIKLNPQRLSRWIKGYTKDNLSNPEYMKVVIDFIKNRFIKNNLDPQEIAAEIYEQYQLHEDPFYYFVENFNSTYKAKNYLLYLEKLIRYETNAFNKTIKQDSKTEQSSVDNSSFPWKKAIIIIMAILIVIIAVLLILNQYTAGMPAAQQSYWNYTYPKEYSGTVWIKITPTTRDIGKKYKYEIIWGPWKYNNNVYFANSLPVFLKYTKKADLSDFSLSFSLSPPCYANVSFGQEEIKINKQNIIDINKGWTSLDDQRVKFIYQTFDSIGDLWSWDNGTVVRTLENTFNGSKVLKLTTNTSFGGCGIQCENGLWDVDIMPDNIINSSVLSFWILAQPENHTDNTLCVQFFDQKNHKKNPVIFWNDIKAKYNEWTHIMIPLDKIRKLSSKIDFHHIDKIEIQQYNPGTYYIENIYIIDISSN